MCPDCGHPLPHGDRGCLVNVSGKMGHSKIECGCPYAAAPDATVRVSIVTISGRQVMYRVDDRGLEELAALRAKPRVATISRSVWDEYSRHVADATQWQELLGKIKGGPR